MKRTARSRIQKSVIGDVVSRLDRPIPLEYVTMCDGIDKKEGIILSPRGTAKNLELDRLSPNPLPTGIKFIIRQ